MPSADAVNTERPGTTKPRAPRVCMVAYACYFNDARIKAYVHSLVRRGISVDAIVLRDAVPTRMAEAGASERLYYTGRKYQGKRTWRYAWSYLSFFVLAFARVTKLQLKHRYAIIHVHNMPNFIVFAAAASRILGARIVLDMHDLFAVQYREKFGDRSIVNAIFALEEKLSCRFAHLIICADSFQKRFLVEERRIPAGKVHVIMNLPDLEIFKRRASPRTRDAAFHLVYHGTVAQRLGIDIILRAVSRLREKVPVRMTIYGSGDFLGECLEVARAEKLESVVTFTRKFFEVEQLPQLLADKDVGIIGNRRSEVTRYMIPVKMLEYMAMGIPVVAPDLGNLTHYFSDQQVCFYRAEDPFDLADKVQYLLEHPSVMRSYAARATEFISKNNWGTCEQRYFKILGMADNICCAGLSAGEAPSPT